MAAFLGREQELKNLETCYARNRFEFCVMYGRRRTGKTTLLNHFRRGKRSVYIACQPGGPAVNLANFNAAIAALFPETGGLSFRSFRDALEMLFRRSREEKLVLVIDEFPSLGKEDPDITSVLQNLIEAYQDASQMFLILCGSSMSYMTEKVLGCESPLYGRSTCQIEVKPFTFLESLSFLAPFSLEEKLALYGAIGGTPAYLKEVDPGLSFEENMKTLFLDPHSPFLEEPVNLLNQETKSAGLAPSAASAVMSYLIDQSLVQKETPFDDPNGKKTIYAISDNFFRFWFRFIAPQRSNIEGGELTEVLYKDIARALTTFLGPVFEDVCRQYLRRRLAAGTLPGGFTEFGRWWGAYARERRQGEIDIVGVAPDNVRLFCACKWRNAPTTEDVLDSLNELSKQFRYTERHLMLFSKSGFTDGCRQLARRIGNVELMSFEDIMAM
ncbi:ATP-binding protein [uncultured Sutterella sp.]|uniref:ATP-binding protein n=1 Tax=uncultured Sutterella sp. TaxID=286133 RepID=UPI002627A34E|nr:ATP-binding protein [uncultured Sutterella sp.]